MPCTCPALAAFVTEHTATVATNWANFPATHAVVDDPWSERSRRPMVGGRLRPVPYLVQNPFRWAANGTPCGLTEFSLPCGRARISPPARRTGFGTPCD